MNRQDRAHESFAPTKQAVHEGMVPMDILRGKQVKCWTVASGTDDAQISAQLWRMSPFGVELLDPDHRYTVGDSLQVGINFGAMKTQVCGTVVASDLEGGRRIAGVRFSKRIDGGGAYIDRSSIRWQCDPFFTPTVQTIPASKIDSVVYFRAAEISSHGMGLVTSTRNRKLVPGTQMSAEIHFPLGAAVAVTLVIKHVKWVEDSGRPHLLLGVELDGDMQAYRLHAGQYLLEFGSQDGVAPSPKALRDVGFATRTQGSRVEFSYVRSTQEYEEVLRLRALSFGQDEEGRKWQKWADKHDTHSRILIGRFRGKILCSGRFVFQDSIDDLEQAAYVKMPPTIPTHDPLTEIGRICTHPDYRGDDLMVQMFRFVMLTMIESGRRYAVCNCTDPMVKMYESIGIRRTGAEFYHPNDGSRHHLLFGDVRLAMYGKKIHPLKWMLLFGEIWDQVGPFVPENAPLWDRARLRLLLQARPLLRPLVAKAMQRKKPKEKASSSSIGVRKTK